MSCPLRCIPFCGPSRNTRPANDLPAPDLGGLFSLPAPEPGLSAPVHGTEAKHLARRSDPDTSRLGAEHAAANLPALQARALSWVRRRPGLTATELAREAGEGDPRVFNRRLGELDKAGRVVRGEKRKCAVTGMMAAVWTAAE